MDPVVTFHRITSYNVCYTKLLREGDGAITLERLERLRQRMKEQKRIDQLHLPGLEDDRRPVIAAGVAVLLALFEGLVV